MNQSKTPEELAEARTGPAALTAEVAEGIPKNAPDLYKDLIFTSSKR